MFDFTVWGEPIPKGRPRVFGRRAITPQRTLDAQDEVRAAFLRAYPLAELLHEDVEILLHFWCGTRQRKDFDNLAKTVTDALNELAFDDDSQIMSALIVKTIPDRRVPGKRGLRLRKKGDVPSFGGKEYQPHTDITIKEIHLG
jgi:Holliday junction resolvase RusA-like endonuclease